MRLSHFLRPVLVLCAVLGPTLLAGQARSADPDSAGRYTIRFYHGRPGEAVVVLPGNDVEDVGGRNPLRTVVLPVGTEVCVRVINPHPGFYTYTLGAVVDTTSVAAFPKEVSEIVTVLSTLLQPGSTNARPALRTLGDQEAALGDYALLLDTLARQVQAVQRAIRRSDQPGLFVGSQGNTVDRRPDRPDFGYVATMMQDSADRWTRPGNFSASKLADDVEGWYKTASDAIGTARSPGLDRTLHALRAHGQNLASAALAIRAVYEKAPDVRLCRDVGQGRATNFVFAVGARDTTSANVATLARYRDTAAVRVRAITRYARPRFEFFPTTFIQGTGADELGLVRDTLRVIDTNPVNFRFGPMLLMNVLRFGVENENALGVGLGVGLKPEGKVVTDALGALMYSARQDFRIGFGLGISHLRTGQIIQGALDQPRPIDAEGINDMVEEDWEFSGYFIFNLLGVKFPNPFGGS